MENRLLAAFARVCFLIPVLVAAAFVVLINARPAFADAGAVTVVIPYGKWVAQFLTSAESFAILVIGGVVAKWAPAYVKSLLTEQVITNAVDYAFGAVAGAIKGRELDLATTNALINAAVSYAVANEPKIAAWLGGALRPAILAKLSSLGAMPASASAADVGAAIAPKGASQ
jgi:hypothetical protein